MANSTAGADLLVAPARAGYTVVDPCYYGVERAVEYSLCVDLQKSNGALRGDVVYGNIEVKNPGPRDPTCSFEL